MFKVIFQFIFFYLLITFSVYSKNYEKIIINGNAIGGCDELYLLDRQQKLDPLLVAS